MVIMQKLYQYTPINERLAENLKKKKIFFSNVNSFNDPLDSYFTILTNNQAINIGSDDFNTGLERIQTFIATKKFIFDELNNLIYYPNDIYDQSKQFALLELIIRKFIGIRCFSVPEICESSTHPILNPVMLSHYADNHKGIVIEYRLDDSNKLFEVKYDNELQHYCFSKVLKSIYFHEQKITIKTNLVEPLCHKFLDWRYENEYRMFNSSPGKAQNCANIGLTISRIYFGTRADPKNVNLIIDSIEQDVDVFWLKPPAILGEKQAIVITDNPEKKGKVHPK